VLQRAADDVLATIPGGELAVWLIGMLTPIVLIFIAFLAIYRLVPNRKVSLAEVWPGAVVATVLWTILRVGFTWYTTNIANYDSAFGPISAAISLLVFLYFASVIVLLGAEVARASVLDDPSKLPAAAFADEVAPPAPAQPPEAQPAITPVATDERVRVPGWAMAVGGAAAAALVRWLSSRRR
jgi:hypothetical protein